MFKFLKVVIAIALLLGLGFWAFKSGYLGFLPQSVLSFLGAPEQTKLDSENFKFEKVKRQDIHQKVLATGTITLKTGAEVKIGARISGQLEKLNVKVGDFVRAGKVIAEIENDDLLARVAQRKAELRSEKAQLAKVKEEGPLEISKAEAEIAELQVQIELSQKTVRRNEELNREGVVATALLDKAVEDLQVLQAKIKVAQEELNLIKARLIHDINLGEANVAKAEANLMEEETRLTYATIKAPIDGVVAFISTQEGETVVASMSAPVFVTLINLKKLEVTVFVDETDIGRVKVGQESVFTVDSFPRKFFHGKVEDIHPKAVIKDNVVNYEVILAIAKEDIKLLRPEMTANVSITTGVHKNVLTISKTAVKRSGKKTFAVVRSLNGLNEQSIELGWREGKTVEILSGLKASDEVGIPKKSSQDKNKPRRRRRR